MQECCFCAGMQRYCDFACRDIVIVHAELLLLCMQSYCNCACRDVVVVHAEIL